MTYQHEAVINTDVQKSPSDDGEYRQGHAKDAK